MPYNSVEDLPDAVKKLAAKPKKAWMDVFNSAFKACLAKGGKDCEGQAAAQAWSVAKKLQVKAEAELEAGVKDVATTAGLSWLFRIKANRGKV
jgi:cation transport regulator ChaB